MLSDTKMVHMLVEVIEHSRKNIDAKPHEQTTSTSILFFLLVERRIMLTLNQTAVNYSLFLFFLKKVGALNEDHIRLNIKL
jgi:hypothetical protein